MNKKKGTIWMSVGLLLLSAALILTINNILGERRAQRISQDVANQLAQQITVFQEDGNGNGIPDYVLYPNKEMPIIVINGKKYIGYLEIPALDKKLPVAAGEWSEEKLKYGPCLYEGSVYQDNIVIAGHNYRSQLGSLYRLPLESEVRFVDGEGNVFTYYVGDTEVINQNDVDAMLEDGEWDLTIFTCTWSGRERYTVRCYKNN